MDAVMRSAAIHCNARIDAGGRQVGVALGAIRAVDPLDQMRALRQFGIAGGDRRAVQARGRLAHHAARRAARPEPSHRVARLISPRHRQIPLALGALRQGGWRRPLARRPAPRRFQR
jgi:hypothetical protein